MRNRTNAAPAERVLEREREDGRADEHEHLGSDREDERVPQRGEEGRILENAERKLREPDEVIAAASDLDVARRCRETPERTARRRARRRRGSPEGTSPAPASAGGRDAAGTSRDSIRLTASVSRSKSLRGSCRTRDRPAPPGGWRRELRSPSGTGRSRSPPSRWRDGRAVPGTRSTPAPSRDAERGPGDVGDRASAGGERDVLGPDSEEDPAARGGGQVRARERKRTSGRKLYRGVRPGGDLPRRDSSAAMPRNVATKVSAGVSYTSRAFRSGRSALVHHDDAVAHRHRLDLVVGDVNRRRTGSLRGSASTPPRARHGASRRDSRAVRRSRKSGGLADDRAGQGDALALAARELAGLAAEQVRRSRGARPPTRPSCGAPRAEPSAALSGNSMLPNREMRVERIALEHHGDAPLSRSEVVDDPAADEDLARGRFLETGDHPQERRLAGPRRAEEDEELALPALQVDVVDRPELPFLKTLVSALVSTIAIRRLSGSTSTWRRSAASPSRPPRRRPRGSRRPAAALANMVGRTKVLNTSSIAAVAYPG